MESPRAAQEIKKDFRIPETDQTREMRLREKIQSLFRDTFEKFVESKQFTLWSIQGENVFDFDDALLEFLDVSQKEIASRRITETQRKRISLFFEEFLSFVGEMRHHPEKREPLEDYLTHWREAAFSYSPNIANRLSLEDRIRFSLLFSKVPELQGTIAPVVGAEATYDLQFCEPAYREKVLREVFARLSPESRLDYVHYLATLGADALAQGWAEDASLSLKRYVETLAADPQQPLFLQYAAEEARQTLEEEERHPSRGVMIFQGDRSVGRKAVASDKVFAEEASHLERLIIPDASSYVEDRIGRLSRDAIASFDQSMTPQSFAWFDARALPEGMDHQVVHFTLFDEMEKQKEAGRPESRAGTNIGTLLQELHRPQMRAALEKDMGVSLAELSLREQIQLLKYLMTTSVEDAQESFAAMKKFGLNAARSFLSCEYGQHLGDTIVQLAGQADESAAKMIFQKYCEIVDITERATSDLMEEFFVVDRGRPLDREKLDNELLARAKDIIAAFVRQDTSPSSRFSAQDASEKLDRFAQDTVLFASMFKTLAKGKTLDFSEVKGISFEMATTTELSAEDKRAMTEISWENWKRIPTMTDFIRSNFQEKLADTVSDARWYVLRKNGEIVAFCRFENRKDHDVYWGSFNVAPSLQDSALGGAVLQEAFEKEGEHRNIIANFHPRTPAGVSYVERYGFMITGVEEVPLKNGGKELGFIISRNKKSQVSYQARAANLSMEFLKSLAAISERTGPYGIRVRRYHLRTEEPRMMQEIEAATDKGHEIVTRFFAEPGNADVRYVVFEPAASERSRAAA